jgi:hypothetical protein
MRNAPIRVTGSPCGPDFVHLAIHVRAALPAMAALVEALHLSKPVFLTAAKPEQCHYLCSFRETGVLNMWTSTRTVSSLRMFETGWTCRHS